MWDLVERGGTVHGTYDSPQLASRACEGVPPRTRDVRELVSSETETLDSHVGARGA